MTTQTSMDCAEQLRVKDLTSAETTGCCVILLIRIGQTEKHPLMLPRCVKTASEAGSRKKKAL